MSGAIAILALSVYAGGSADASANRAGFIRGSVSPKPLRGETSGRLEVAIWYPAPAESATRTIEVGPPGRPYFAEGTAANGAPIIRTPVRLPLIVVSHGTGGSAMDLAWLCAGLARRGYIVAAVNHPGNNALEPTTLAGTTRYWLRAVDLSRVIDGMLAMPRFGSRIDRDRIGAIGESLGGYTVLELAGARTDIRRFESYCARRPRTPVCTGRAAGSSPASEQRIRAFEVANARDPATLAASRDSYRDARVKAVFAIEPAEGPETIAASLAAVRIPIAFIAGFGDDVLPITDNVIPDALGVAKAELSLLPRPAGHYTFLMNCTAAGRRTYSALCADSGIGRLTAHERTLRLAASFFARTIGSSTR